MIIWKEGIHLDLVTREAHENMIAALLEFQKVVLDDALALTTGVKALKEIMQNDTTCRKLSEKAGKCVPKMEQVARDAETLRKYFEAVRDQLIAMEKRDV